MSLSWYWFVLVRCCLRFASNSELAFPLVIHNKTSMKKSSFKPSSLNGLLLSLTLISGCAVHPVPARSDTAPATAATPEKKLIWHGWGTPSAQDIRDNWREFDKLPFDGFSVVVPVDSSKPVTGDGSSQNRLGWNIFKNTPLKIEQFRPAIADIKTAQWKHINSLFLPVATSSFGQDENLNWFDDARWKTINNNWQVLFTIAKDAGMKGILFDPEHYDYSNVGAELFSYQDHRAKRADKSFAEYNVIAKRRGRELMQSVSTIYPDATMFCIYAYDLALYDAQLGKTGANGRYALLPAFLDGMLEGANPRTQWTDGWEFAYGYKQRAQFLEGYHSVRNKAAQFAGNPDLYAQKMRAGFGLMMDYNSNKNWSATDITHNHFSPAEWKNSVEQALRVSDEYVWIYTQAPTFYPRRDMPDAYFQATVDGRAASLKPEPVYLNAPIDNKKTATTTPATQPVASPATPANIVAASDPPSGPNLVSDADFEATRVVKDSNQPVGWYLQSWDKSVEEDDPAWLNGSAIVEGPAHSGKSSYKFVVSDKVYAKYGEGATARTVYRMGAIKSKNIPVNTGDKLAFSFWYKANDMKGAGDFVVQFHKTGTNEKMEQPIANGSRVQFNETRVWRELGPDPKITGDENGWRKVEVRNLLVPNGYKVAQLVLKIQGTQPGDYMYVDDVSLARE